MPELSCLHVDGVFLQFNSAIFLNLTELSLSNIELNVERSIETTSLKTLLARMGKLKTLAISNIMLESSITADIPLPDSLRYLEYASTSSLPALPRFVPSPVVHVRVVMTTTPSNAKSRKRVKSLTKTLNSWFKERHPATVVALYIRYNTVAAEACVAYWRNPNDHATGMAPDFELVRFIDEDFGISDILLGSIYDRVTHISFDLDWEFPLLSGKDGWLHEIGPLPKLRSLHFTGPRASTTLPHLSRWSQQDSTISWQPSQLFMEDRAAMGDVRILRDWLAARSSRGLPLQKLTLPAHVGVALDEAAVADDVGPNDWRPLVSDVHIDHTL